MSLVNLLGLSLVELVGDLSLRTYANGGALHFLGLGSLGYIGVVYFLIRSLRGSTLLYVNGMWDGLSALITTIASIVILQEGLKNVWQYIGIAFIICGLFLLHRK